MPGSSRGQVHDAVQHLTSPYDGTRVTPSWGGSMFEALMPTLFVPEDGGSDVLSGGPGDDLLAGGPGPDHHEGGTGDNRCPDLAAGDTANAC
jgi:hypothetical protein